MLPRIHPTTTKSWEQLKAHYKDARKWQMKSLFAEDKNRFTDFSLSRGDIFFDYSKNIITHETLRLLLQLANDCGLPRAVENTFKGEKINQTENRSVLHTALRNFSGQPVYSEGKDIMPDVQNVLAQMKKFCEEIHSGTRKGFTGKKIRYIVNIGIGGSDLGPLMVTEALKPYWQKGIQPYFVSNVDAGPLMDLLGPSCSLEL